MHLWDIIELVVVRTNRSMTGMTWPTGARVGIVPQRIP
jgi:hypothetical protein